MNWHEFFKYDPETGKLFWAAVPNNRIKLGDEAGYVNGGTGYIHVKVSGINTMAHRLIWDMHNPDDLLGPNDEIDHIDHDKLNNRLDNLRKVYCAINQRNRPMHRDNTSGVTGVCWYKRHQCWRVQIRAYGKPKHIGYFKDFNAAVSARKAAEVEFGFHENHGKR